jgi:hypothetical protein
MPCAQNAGLILVAQALTGKSVRAYLQAREFMILCFLSLRFAFFQSAHKPFLRSQGVSP